MQPHKCSLKANFLISQIEQVSAIKNSLEYILFLTRKTLHLTNPQEQNNACEEICQKMDQIHSEVSHCIYVTKLESHLEIDACKIEEESFCQSYDTKIQQLNKALITAENCVQAAQNVRRENDRKAMPYKPNNQKTFRKRIERVGLETAININYHFRRQYVRNIELLLRAKQLNITQNCHKLRNLGLLQSQQVGFRKYRQIEGLNRYRRSHSEQRIITKPIQVGRNQISTLFLMQEGGKNMLKQLLVSLLTQLKTKNKAKTTINSSLQQSLDLANKYYVLSHLRTRQDLNYEESIAKIELEALIFGRDIQEKMLGVESRREAWRKSRAQFVHRDKRKSEVKLRRKKNTVRRRSYLSV